MKITAPWTPEQVEALRQHQSNPMFHGYTCPGVRAECHKHRLLVPTSDGWVCACGHYKQDWAHEVTS